MRFYKPSFIYKLSIVFPWLKLRPINLAAPIASCEFSKTHDLSEELNAFLLDFSCLQRI